MILAVVIGAGLGLLISIAVVIGQDRAHEEAWIRIARERRRLAEIKRLLTEIAIKGGFRDVLRRLEKLDP